MFPQPRASSLVDVSAPGRSAKRRRLDPPAKSRAGTETSAGASQPTDDVDFSPHRAVLIETLWESFLISRRSEVPAAAAEKENASGKDKTSITGTQAHRYTVALLPGIGGAAGKPRKVGDVSEKMDTTTTSAPKKDEASKSEASEVASSDPVLSSGATTNGNASANRQQSSTTPSSSKLSLGGRISTRGAPPPLSLPLTDSSEDDDSALQTLHRDLGEENIQFTDDGIAFLSDEVANGMRKGWKMEARRWRWVQVDVASS